MLYGKDGWEEAQYQIELSKQADMAWLLTGKWRFLFKARYHHKKSNRLMRRLASRLQYKKTIFHINTKETK